MSLIPHIFESLESVYQVDEKNCIFEKLIMATPLRSKENLESNAKTVQSTLFIRRPRSKLNLHVWRLGRKPFLSVYKGQDLGINYIHYIYECDQKIFCI